MKKIPIYEAGLSIVSIWWAIVLYTNSDLFNQIPGFYRIFKKVIPNESGWAIFFLIAAMVKILGIVIENKGIRLIGLYMSVFLYAVISAGYILSKEPLQPGTGIHFVLMIFALWAIREVKGHE